MSLFRCSQSLKEQSLKDPAPACQPLPIYDLNTRNILAKEICPARRMFLGMIKNPIDTVVPIQKDPHRFPHSGTAFAVRLLVDR